MVKLLVIMIKEEWIRDFSEKLKKGFTITQIQDEALSRGYRQEDINDTFSVILGNESHNSNNTSDNLKALILFILIIIVLAAIIIIIMINLDKKEPEKIIEINKTEVISEKYFEKINVSTQMFNNSNLYSQDNFSLYLKNNPQQIENSMKLTKNLANCNNTDANFSGDISNSHYNGGLYIEDMGNNNCLVGCRANINMDCNFTKEQIKDVVETMELRALSSNPSLKNLSGPFYYFGCIFEIDFRMLADTFKSKLNETLESSNLPGNFTYGADLMTDKITRNFTSNITGKVYQIPCELY